MVAYRRSRIANAPYFLTLTLRDRAARHLVDRIDDLRDAFRSACVPHPYQTLAIVILPDHLHWLCRLPDGDADFSARVRAIKRHFTRRSLAGGDIAASGRHGEYRLWQSRFREHTVRNEDDLKAHVDYIHYNPVKHGHVASVRDWPHSSFHRFVRQGFLPEDWGGTVEQATDQAGHGERPVTKAMQK